MFAAPALLIGLGLGILLKRWSVVAVLAAVGLVVSIVGWQASWFADEETPALGGAILFWLLIWVPVAVGAGIGVHLRRSRSRRNDQQRSTLPVVWPPSDRGDR